MLTITTKVNDAGNFTAKAQGKQRTVKPLGNGKVAASHASAVGALLNVLLDDRQKAMLRHPSGGQRVRVRTTGFGERTFTINV